MDPVLVPAQAVALSQATKSLASRLRCTALTHQPAWLGWGTNLWEAQRCHSELLEGETSVLQWCRCADRRLAHGYLLRRLTQISVVNYVITQLSPKLQPPSKKKRPKAARLLCVTVKRSYADGCAAAHALDLIGERWALLVVRELLLGPKRFTDLRSSLAHLSPNVLSQRLKDLEQVGVLERHKLPPPAGVWVYQLTRWGAELEPVIAQLVRWGVRSPSMPFDAKIGVDPLILTMRTMFNPQAAAALNATIQLQIEEAPFLARVTGGKLELIRGNAPQPDAVIQSDTNTLKGLTFGGRSVKEAVQAGTVSIQGNLRLAEQFLALFKLPGRDQPDQSGGASPI